MRKLILSVSMFGLTVGALVAQQQTTPVQPVPPPTFKVEINYVEVDTVVTDEQGNLVRNLTQNDFQILEDGKPQKISAFAAVDIPVERVDRPASTSVAATVEPDVRTNEQAFDGRLYLIVLDDFHTSALRSQLVKRSARQFIERYVGKNDIAAVVYTSGRVEASQDFTNSQRLLLAAVDKFLGRKLRSSALERMDEYYRLRDQERLNDDPRLQTITDPMDFERGYQARNALRAIKNLAEFLANIRGRRKALIWISEGIDYNVMDAIGQTESGVSTFLHTDAAVVRDAIREAIGAAARNNVSIYGVDPRGLIASGDEIIEIGSLAENPNLGLGPQDIQNEIRRGQDSLRTLSEQTGGFAAVSSNDLGSAFERIVRDNSTYYILGYYPTNDRRDGRYRKIEVKLNRPGLKVRARKGYLATPPPKAETRAATDMSPELRDALDYPLPVSGLPVQIVALPFKGATSANASVAVVTQVSGPGMKFTQKDGTYEDSFEVVYRAVDQEGKIRGGNRARFDMKLKPETYKVVAKTGVRTVYRLELPPGRYQIRVAARETGGGAMGSVHYDVEVPDYSKQPLAISGLALTSRLAAATPTPQPDEPLQQVLPAPPTTAREFTSDDILALYVEVYDSVTSPSHRIDIETTVRSDDGKVVFKSEDPRSSDELKGARGSYGHAAQVPLNDLAPGLYVLRVEAKSRLTKGGTAARETVFRVRGGTLQ